MGMKIASRLPVLALAALCLVSFAFRAAWLAADNLMLVAGRIGILEIYVVAAMIWSVALYVRGRPVLAGLAAGVAACMKLFALDIVLVFGLLELLRWRAGLRAGWRRLV